MLFRSHIWKDAGEPEGGSARFTDEAKMLVAIEENPSAGTLDPEEAAEPVVEEAALMRNLGEFPTLTDQGEEIVFPDEANDDDEDDDYVEGDVAVGDDAGSADTNVIRLAENLDNDVRLSQGEDDEIRLSDLDASETGGVLPDEDVPDEDMADISVADADVTSDDTDSDNQEFDDEDDEDEDEDINDDDLADQPVFDR